MSHPAFLRAIASEPADDTARLAYADFLEETGEPAHVARAEFIRTQIEAHTLHANHPRRAELEARAAALFADHWSEWWLPVCEATGLPLSFTGPPGLRERVLRIFGRSSSRVSYRLEQGTTLAVVQPRPPAPQTTLRRVTFERGFPQSINLLGQLRDFREAIHAWTTVAPLTSLHLHGTVGREWRLIDGEHLRGVRELILDASAATAVTAIAASPHLPHLEDLTLRPDRSNAAWTEEQKRAYADSSLVERVRRLNVVVGSVLEVVELHGPHLANLIGLNLRGIPDDTGIEAEAAARWAGAEHGAVSSYLTGLKELSLSGFATAFASGAPTDWRPNGLRRLVLEDLLVTKGICDLIRRDPFAALVDLTISSRCDIGPFYAALTESPLAERLRHLRLTGGFVSGKLISELIHALDPEKLETLALDRGVSNVPGLWDELQERFPGRVSVV